MHNITDSAVKYSSHIPKDWLEYMKEPKTIVSVKFPVTFNNEIKTFSGVRIIHSNHIVPAKGGLRFSDTANQDDLIGLATLMSYKAALHKIPFGGAKGCIYIDPKKFTYEEKVKIVRRFTMELWKRAMISSATDVMNPDTGTDDKMMNIIRETYKDITNSNDVNIDAVVTGKGVAFGGIGVSKQAAGYGVAQVAKYVEENMSNKILSQTQLNTGNSKKSVILHGFGVTAHNCAKELFKTGNFKIVGITDEGHGCFNQMGFNPDEIYEYKKKNNGLHGISKSLNKPEEILAKKCDIFIANQNELCVTKTIAENINCRMLIEAANSPCTEDALEVLKQKKVLVIPDILAYSGGFIVSYLEWIKNLEHRNLTLMFKRFESNSRKTFLQMMETSSIGLHKDTYHGPTEDELVLMSISEVMDSSFKRILDCAEDSSIDLKLAAYKIAIDRIYDKSKNSLTNV